MSRSAFPSRHDVVATSPASVPWMPAEPLGVDLFIPKGHVIGSSTKPQEVFDVLSRGSFFRFESQGRNETAQPAVGFEFAEEIVGSGLRPTLLGFRTPTKVICTRRSDVDAPDALVVMFAGKGPVNYVGKSGEIAVASGDIFVSRAQDMCSFTIAPGTEGGRLIVAAGDVVAAMRALGVSDATSMPAFDSPAPRMLGLTTQLAIQRTVSMVNNAYSKRAVDFAWRQVREHIAMSLLVEHPHSMSDSVTRGEQVQTSPRQIRRALEFIEQFAHHDISLGDIAVASQCSARNLSRLFREITRTTPMTFLRELRLDRARAQIVDRPDQPLGDIAVQWGFCHSGQFARLYRQKFGESPSETRTRY